MKKLNKKVVGNYRLWAEKNNAKKRVLRNQLIVLSLLFVAVVVVAKVFGLTDLEGVN